MYYIISELDGKQLADKIIQIEGNNPKAAVESYLGKCVQRVYKKCVDHGAPYDVKVERALIVKDQEAYKESIMCKIIPVAKGNLQVTAPKHLEAVCSNLILDKYSEREGVYYYKG